MGGGLLDGGWALVDGGWGLLGGGWASRPIPSVRSQRGLTG